MREREEKKSIFMNLWNEFYKISEVSVAVHYGSPWNDGAPQAADATPPIATIKPDIANDCEREAACA